MRRTTTATEMSTHRCKRCRHFWTSNTHPAAAVITSFCPNCIPVISHRLTHDSPHIRTVTPGAA